VNTTNKLAEAARQLDDAIKDLPDGCEGWLEPLDERIAGLRAALAAHDAEQAQEAQQAAQVGALPEPLTDDDAYRIVCEFFNQPWYRRVATEVVRATEKAHGIGATTGKEPGNV